MPKTKKSTKCMEPWEEDDLSSDDYETTNTYNGLIRFCSAESTTNSSMYGGGASVVMMPFVMMMAMMAVMAVMANSL